MIPASIILAFQSFKVADRGFWWLLLCTPSDQPCVRRRRSQFLGAATITDRYHSPMDEEVSRPHQLGIHHFGLSVTDVDRSTKFYRDVLGAEIVGPRHAPEEFSGYRTVIRLGSHTIDLNQFSANQGTKFDPARTGLDHLALSAGSPEDLEVWARWLDRQRVPRSTIRLVRGVGPMFDFVDPDGIQIEFLFLDPDSPWAQIERGTDQRGR
jgi:glyoxylase I family protein